MWQRDIVYNDTSGKTVYFYWFILTLLQYNSLDNIYEWVVRIYESYFEICGIKDDYGGKKKTFSHETFGYSIN